MGCFGVLLFLAWGASKWSKSMNIYYRNRIFFRSLLNCFIVYCYLDTYIAICAVRNVVSYIWAILSRLRMTFWSFWHHFYCNWIFQATFCYVNHPIHSKTDKLTTFFVILQLLHLPLPKDEGNAVEAGDFANVFKIKIKKC